MKKTYIITNIGEKAQYKGKYLVTLKRINKQVKITIKTDNENISAIMPIVEIEKAIKWITNN